jgi:hypothetical protein
MAILGTLADVFISAVAMDGSHFIAIMLAFPKGIEKVVGKNCECRIVSLAATYMREEGTILTVEGKVFTFR